MLFEHLIRPYSRLQADDGPVMPFGFRQLQAPISVSAPDDFNMLMFQIFDAGTAWSGKASLDSTALGAGLIHSF